jgi:hypothetical protein
MTGRVMFLMTRTTKKTLGWTRQLSSATPSALTAMRELLTQLEKAVLVEKWCR